MYIPTSIVAYPTYLFYFQPFVVRCRVKSSLFLWDGLKIPLIANGEKYHWKKERTDGSCYIYSHCLLLILFIYLLIYFISWSLIREIVVVSLRWFKNPSNYWKKRKKEQMLPAYVYSHIDCCLSYLLTYFIPWSFVKSSLFLWDGLKIPLNGEEHHWKKRKKERKSRWFLPYIFPYQLLLILLIYLFIYLFYSMIIVVVFLRWSFKNSSDHRKERRKE